MKELLTKTTFVAFTLLLCSVMKITAQQIPIKYKDNLYVEAIIAGNAKGRFIYDTGAGITIIDSTFLQKNGVRLGEVFPVTMNGLGENKIEAIYCADTLSINFGEYTAYSSATILTDLKTLIPLDSIDGVLGVGILNDTIYRVDYQNSIIEILNQKELDKLQGYNKIVYNDTESGFIQFPITIKIGKQDKDTIRGYAHYDSGSSAGITLSVDSLTLAKISNEIQQPVIYDMSVLGVGGGGRLIHLQAFEMVMNNDVKSCVNSVSIMPDSDIPNGLIGNDIMAQFDVVIDARNHVLYLRANSQYGNIEPTSLSTYSILNNNGEYRVFGVSLTHPTPMKIGDKIIAIDSTPIEAIYKDGLEMRYRVTPNLKHIVTIERNGKQIDIETTNLSETTKWQLLEN